MTMRAGEMTMRHYDEHHEPQLDREGAYEHPALEPEPGYWAGRWAEFKRLFAQSWNNGYVKETVILCAVVWVVTVFGMAFLGWR